MANNEFVIEKYQFAVASTDEEKARIYKMRYDIYIKEMKRIQNCADHVNGTIKEDIDDSSLLLYATEVDETDIVGSSRITVLNNVSNNLITHYGIDKIQRCLDVKISEGTKLMINIDYRRPKTDLGKYMLQYGYKVLRDNHVAYDFLNANPYLVSYYSRYGYRKCECEFIHPELNDMVIPMILVTDDIEHFKAINSPLLGIAEMYNNDADYKGLLRRVPGFFVDFGYSYL